MIARQEILTVWERLKVNLTNQKTELKNLKRNEDEEKVWYLISNEESAYRGLFVDFDYPRIEKGAKELKSYLWDGKLEGDPLKKGYLGDFNPTKLRGETIKIKNLILEASGYWIQVLKVGENYKKMSKEITDLQKELEKERGWWEKWLADFSAAEPYTINITETGANHKVHYRLGECKLATTNTTTTLTQKNVRIIRALKNRYLTTMSGRT